jgi:predicted regulator of Ras-like GTPase activity (Roadblock/LC7/MglB family)
MTKSERKEALRLRKFASATQESIEHFVADHFEAIVAAVCTEDGFVISQANTATCTIEEDKMASIASTLFSMCSAAVQNIKAGNLRYAIVDSDSANLVFCTAVLFGRNVVLTVAMSHSVSLGQTLFLVNRLKKELEANAPESA